MGFITQGVIAEKIFLIRGHKVMLDRDLAKLYGVEAKYLKRQVRRNIDRFPPDFMFKLSKREFKNWRCQFGTSNFSDRMGLRYPPYAFTEPGVAMLSSILNSNRAIHVNIQIIRTFIKLRQILSTHKELAHKLVELERKIEKHDGEIRTIFEAIRQLMVIPEKPKRRIGFHPN
jgi:phage regulator Rha-like protein